MWIRLRLCIHSLARSYLNSVDFTYVTKLAAPKSNSRSCIKIYIVIEKILSTSVSISIPSRVITKNFLESEKKELSNKNTMKITSTPTT